MNDFWQKIRNSVATKLTIWFMILFLFPLATLVFFIRGSFSESFVELNAKNLLDQTKLWVTSMSRVDDELLKNLVSNQPGADLNIFLIDKREGVIVQGGRANFNFLDGMFTPDLIKEVLNKDEGTLVSKDAKWIVAYKNIPTQNYIVGMASDNKIYASFISRVEKDLFVNLAVAFLIVLSIGGVIIFLVMQPILYLVDIVSRVGGGDLDILIEPTEFDGEIEVLADGLNKMTKNLKTSRKHLQESGIVLEQTVQERTHELNQKLDELEKMNKLMIDRELKMVELKKEIDDLKRQPL